MRAHLVLVRLPYMAEALEREIEALVAILPPGSRRVLAEEHFLGFLVPHVAIADIQAVRWRKVMEAFSNWWIVGLNGELACKNKSVDPFSTWMNEFRRTGAVVERDEPENVPLSQRREPRVEPSVHELIERTFGKVRLKPDSGQDGPK
mgnify:CR=1 FL=1